MGWASLIAPVAGALLGGASGSKGQTTTQDNTPAIYKSPEGQALLKQMTGGYGDLLTAAQNNFKTPFMAAPSGRVTSGAGGAYGTLFDNPEMMQIQKQRDMAYLQSLQNPQPTQNPTQQPNQAQNRDMMQGQILAQHLAAQPTKAGQPWQMFVQRATPEDYAQLGTLASNATIGSGMYGGGLIDKTTGQPIQGIDQILAKYMRG